MEEKKVVKGYKGFDKNMQCKGFQYEVGKTYKYDGDIKLCESGFHFCELPQDVFNYYTPAECKFAEVEAEEVSNKKSEDSKRVSKQLTINTEISVFGICKIAVQTFFENFGFKEKIESATTNTAGDRGAASAGDRGAASAGYRGAASAGDSGAASAGYRGAASAGDSGAASAGDRGAASVDKFGVAICENGKVKGGLNSIIAIYILDDNGDVIKFVYKKVDGKRIKADTWYELKKGKFAEVK